MVIEINNFLSYEECDNLISLASDTFDEVGVLGESIEGYRVAKGAWLDEEHGDVVIKYRDLISETTKLPKINMESIHVVKYSVGEEYKDEFKLLEILSNEFIDYNIVKIDLSNVVYTSDRYYGLSNNTEKLYHILLKYITHHLFSLGISKKVNIKLFSDELIFSLDNLNVEFSLDGQHIVKKEWLESLILDVFPFGYTDLKNKFNLDNIKFQDEIVTNNELCVWKRLDLSPEFVLV